MKYYYEIYDKYGIRFQNCDKLEELEKTDIDYEGGQYVRVYNLASTDANIPCSYLVSKADEVMWRTKLEREFAWKPEKDLHNLLVEEEFPFSKNPAGVTKQDMLKVYEEDVYDVWKEPKKKIDPINPKHYKEIVPGMQYMEMMQYMLKDKTGVVAHLYGQIYKYLMRAGQKDAEIQELDKVAWYLDFLRAHLKSGRPITVAEIRRLLTVEGTFL